LPYPEVSSPTLNCPHPIYSTLALLKRTQQEYFLKRRITKIGITEQKRKVATTIRNVEQFRACSVYMRECIYMSKKCKPDGLVYMK
jgi:hypothetical protein